MVTEIKETKKITVRLILAWIFSIMFIIAGLGNIISSFMGGLFMILAGAIILPPLDKIVKEKYNIKLSGWLKVFIVIILLIISGLLISPESENLNNIQEKSLNLESKEINTLEKNSQTQPKEKIYSIGEKIKVGDMTFIVNEVFTLPFVGSSYLYEEANGIFIILSLDIENNGKEEVFLSVNSFEFKDSQGRKYNVDTGASIYLNTMGFDAFMFEKLGAGLKTNGDIIFDVPTDNKGLILEITGEGFFADTVKVNIGDVSDYN